MASATSIAISRLLPLSSTTTFSLFPVKSLQSRNLSFSSFTSSFIRPLKSKPIRINSSSYSSSAISASLAVGTKLPDATLSYLDSANEVQTITVSDLTKSKKAILFAVPGAFTPTCSQKHVPGFVEKAGELKAKGVDVIACVSVNDVFVMKAWKESLNIGDEVLLLSDGNLELTKAIGTELDLSDKPVGLGVRSRRYSMLVDDGVVKVLNLEEGGAFTSSGAEDILKVL